MLKINIHIKYNGLTIKDDIHNTINYFKNGLFLFYMIII